MQMVLFIYLRFYCLKMKIVEIETKTKIKNPLHTKDLLKFKITGRDGAQWFLIRTRLI